MLVQLRATILIDGRLDPRQPEVPYGEQEARQAFSTALRVPKLRANPQLRAQIERALASIPNR